jgi:Tfp pilus assembly protein PilE
MNTRRAVTLIEFLVVFGILAILTGLLLPAVQKARERALEIKCKNNLYQLNLAVGEYVVVHKSLPKLGSDEIIGGWSYEILPFIEQKALHDCTKTGIAISAAPEAILRPPPIFCCPFREERDEPTVTNMLPANYVLVPTSGRDSFLLFDAPIQLQVPWASGPELSHSNVVNSTGPHHGGFFFSQGFQEGVGFVLNGQQIGW